MKNVSTFPFLREDLMSFNRFNHFWIFFWKRIPNINYQLILNITIIIFNHQGSSFPMNSKLSYPAAVKPNVCVWCNLGSASHQPTSPRVRGRVSRLSPPTVGLICFSPFKDRHPSGECFYCLLQTFHTVRLLQYVWHYLSFITRVIQPGMPQGHIFCSLLLWHETLNLMKLLPTVKSDFLSLFMSVILCI